LEPCSFDLEGAMTYRDVQFLGYAIPTIPLVVSDVGDPNGPGFVEGRYIGIEPPTKDIDERIALIVNAARQTLASGSVVSDPGTLKVFVVPEFSIRGDSGAYNNDPPTDFFTYFRTGFAQAVADAAFADWLFVIGTVVTTVQYDPDPSQNLKARVREDLAIALGNAWQYAYAHGDQKMADAVFNLLVTYTQYSHSDPIYEVLNRCYVVPGGTTPDKIYPDGLSVEKKFISNEDFVLNLYTNAFAEEDVVYPDIDERDGEDKEAAFDPLSIFTIAGIKFGIEVCLDHSRARLRRNRRPDTELVQIQLVPSCGMQIVQGSIIAGKAGLVFNCDGQYDNLDPTSQPNATDSVWTTTESNQAHTQLTAVVTPCTGNTPGTGDAVVQKPQVTVRQLMISDSTAPQLFAYGSGEVHIYSPLAIPPPS
jgi:hypothetical protein